MSLGHPTLHSPDTYESQQFGPASPTAGGYFSQPAMYVYSNIVAWWQPYKDFFYNPHVHNGLDVAGPLGHPLYALETGKIREVGWRTNGGGYVIEVEVNPDCFYTFNHCSGFPAGMAEGVRVAKGQIIAFIGSSGVATGNHCHTSLDLDERGPDGITRRLMWNPRHFMAGGPFANDPRIVPEGPPEPPPDTSTGDPDLALLARLRIPADTGRLFDVAAGVQLRKGPGVNYPKHYLTKVSVKYRLVGFDYYNGRKTGWIGASSRTNPASGVFYVPPAH